MKDESAKHNIGNIKNSDFDLFCHICSCVCGFYAFAGVREKKLNYTVRQFLPTF